MKKITCVICKEKFKSFVVGQAMGCATFFSSKNNQLLGTYGSNYDLLQIKVKKNCVEFIALKDDDVICDLCVQVGLHTGDLESKSYYGVGF